MGRAKLLIELLPSKYLDYKMMHRFTLFVAIGLLFVIPVQAEDAIDTRPVVKYDKVQDSLSLTAEDVSLRHLLALIAMQSHIEVLFDDLAEQTISMTLEDRPLESALKTLLRGSSYAFRYNKGEDDKLLLIGVKVLPEGGGNNAQPLLHAAGEAFMHEKNNRLLSIEEQARQDAYNQRWLSRLAEMPPAIREKVTEHAKQRIADQDKRAAERAARSKKKKAQREARKAERKQKRQQEFDAMSEEEQAMALQRQDDARERARANAQ